MNDGALRDLAEVDRLIHEPARLVICTILYTVKEADFLFLLNESGLTKGNLSSHLTKLEEAGYIDIRKIFNEKKPQTLCSMTPAGRSAFEEYRKYFKKIIERMNGE
ncbi:MAG TPA: transcriptional regulator [Anaerolineaceae bacterium]|jgi:DNA-binding MarR family transcriptional regulator|nr:transcriptional regulator [Anaerolineaceae bacterium]